MKIDQLIYFNETARLEHIGKASKVLGISTSAISHSIASLEGELGYDLFEKKGKNIVLTDHGRNLLSQSQELINQFQNLKQSLLSKNSEKMHFRIASVHLLSHEVVAPAWSKLLAQYPQVTIELMSYRSAEVVSSVLNREIDFGICFSPQPHPELESDKIHEGELLLVVRKNHPVLKLKGEKRIQALNEFPAVLPKAFQGIDLCLTHPMFEKFGLRPNASTLTDSYNVALSLVQQSKHWSFVPDVVVQNYKNIEVIRASSGWSAPYSISAIYLKKRFVPKFFHDLREQIKMDVSG